MYLFIIRHTESEKNIKNQFSSVEDNENLTERGAIDSQEIANAIVDFVKKKSLNCKKIYSANSTRSKKTANEIAKKLNVELNIEEDLRSTRPGALEGISKSEVKDNYPEYGHQYYLFDKGLFNAYEFNAPENKEPKKDFEQRVNGCVDKILSDKSEDIKIIVAHRSSITAILLEFARKYCKYPLIFSGHISLDLGYISVLKEIESGQWQIVKVNEKYNVLNEL